MFQPLKFLRFCLLESQDQDKADIVLPSSIFYLRPVVVPGPMQEFYFLSGTCDCGDSDTNSILDSQKHLTLQEVKTGRNTLPQRILSLKTFHALPGGKL